MLRSAHPEVLHPDWLPPVALDRAREVQRAREHLLAGLGSGRPARLAIVGPTGSGTSTIARLAARAVAEELRRSRADRPPLVSAVRARSVRGVRGIATEILRGIDPGFMGRGFHATEILAGVLRRLRRDQRAVVAVVDDLGPSAGDLTPLLRAFTDPDHFLPEGESGMPPMALVLAGVPEARGTWRAAAARGVGPEDLVELAAYEVGSLERIMKDRAERALGRPPPEGWMDSLTARLAASGRGASHAIELLRRELTRPPVTPWRAPVPGERTVGPVIEPPLLAALSHAAAKRPATIAEIRRWEREFALREGSRPLPTTTFWRRIVRLESVGVVHREVRAGGAGGTRSLVELLRPISGLPFRETRGTPPGAGWTVPVVPSGGPA